MQHRPHEIDIRTPDWLLLTQEVIFHELHPPRYSQLRRNMTRSFSNDIAQVLNDEFLDVWKPLGEGNADGTPATADVDYRAFYCGDGGPVPSVGEGVDVCAGGEAVHGACEAGGSGWMVAEFGVSNPLLVFVIRRSVPYYLLRVYMDQLLFLNKKPWFSDAQLSPALTDWIEQRKQKASIMFTVLTNFQALGLSDSVVW